VRSTHLISACLALVTALRGIKLTDAFHRLFTSLLSTACDFRCARQTTNIAYRENSMRSPCFASIIFVATALAGCASSFNADIYNKNRGSQIVLPDCNVNPQDSTRVANAPEIPTPATRTRPALNTLGLDRLKLPDVNRTDPRLAANKNLAVGLEVLKAVESDRGMRGQFQQLLGVDLAEISKQAPWITAASLTDAQAALQELDHEGLSSGSDLNGKTFIKEDYEHLTAAVSKATASYGWTAMFAESLGKFAQRATEFQEAYSRLRNARPAGANLYSEDSVTSTGTSAIDALVDAQETSTFSAYFVAYFRDGKIFDVQFDSNDLQQKVENAIKNYASGKGTTVDPTLLNDVDNQLSAFNNKLMTDLCKSAPSNGACTVLGGIGQTTFVTRAGKSLAFSGITVTLDPEGKKAISTTKPNYLTVGEDLLRVAIEASWDFKNPVPGVDNSTLCKELQQCATTTVQKQGVAAADSAGDTTEAATSQVVEIVVRGGWLFSLNNEAAAESLTTGISVVARKIAERIAYAKAAATCTSPGTRIATINFHGRAP
jgi:hypothetical protein